MSPTSGTELICGEGVVDVGGGGVVTGGGVGVGGVTTGGRWKIACHFWAMAVNQVRSFGGVVVDAAFVDGAATIRVMVAVATGPVASGMSVTTVGVSAFVGFPGDTAFTRRGVLAAGFAEGSFATARNEVSGDAADFFVFVFDGFEIGFEDVEGAPEVSDFDVAEIILFDTEFTDERDVLGPGDDDGPDSDASDESAKATPQPARTAAPMPIATAKPPTRPTYAPAPTVPHPLDAFID